MSAAIIDGRAIAAQIKSEVAADITQLRSAQGVVPGLAVVLVGDNPASVTYVNSKSKTCEKLGMKSVVNRLPATTSQRELFEVIDALNHDASLHGILVQLPLPQHLDAHATISALDPRKDVDGLHPHNIGLLCMGVPRFIPCTPSGVCELLTRSQVTVSGREVVIVGRSNLVGRPLSLLLSSKGRFGDGTVTVCHSRSANIGDVCRRADILVVAIGQPNFVRGSMVKRGAVVIDVGIHPAAGPDGKMCGDVDFNDVLPVASMLTPVPGGVGPMTIAMLMRNTTDAAAASVGFRFER